MPPLRKDEIRLLERVVNKKTLLQQEIFRHRSEANCHVDCMVVVALKAKIEVLDEVMNTSNFRLQDWTQ